jgi:hypothetical protein
MWSHDRLFTLLLVKDRQDRLRLVSQRTRLLRDLRRDRRRQRLQR